MQASNLQQPRGAASPAFEPSPILGTVVLPWREDGTLDEARFTSQITRIARTVSRHLYIFGTAGEGYAVSDAQFAQITGLFLRTGREQGVRPMIGVISLSLATIIERIEFGRSLGAREFQLSLPSWGPLNDAELDRFFAETCGRFPDCHFLHYNLVRAKRVLVPADYQRVIAQHPNLVAVKTGISDPQVVAELIKIPRLRFYFTEAGYAVARRLGGNCGLLISLSSVNPKLALEYVAGNDQRRAELTQGIQAILAALRQVAGERFHIDGGYDKLLWSVHDPDFPLRLLPPYEGPRPGDAALFRRSLPLDWLPANQ
jgi:dihydrodipicolinate synthase/N-acetylneuraminate lyase